MTNNLENKIYEYFCSLGYIFIESVYNKKTVAHDIAEICEKEWQDRIDCEKCNDLQDENTSLKQQLKAVKYIDRETLEEMFIEHSADIGGVTGASLLTWDSPNFKAVMDELLSFAIPKVKTLDRDEVEKIINPHRKSDILGEHYDLSANDITTICNLAYNKDKIIEVLNEWIDFNVTTSDDEKFESSSKQLMFSKIADEIIDKDNI